jgi:hypothetical protein
VGGVSAGKKLRPVRRVEGGKIAWQQTGLWRKDEDLFALSNSTMNTEIIPTKSTQFKPYIREVGRLTYLFPEFKVQGMNDYKAFPLENFESKFDPKVDIGYQLLKVKRGESRWLHKDGSFSWRPCSLESYNEQTKEIVIRWDSNGRTKAVKRMNVILAGEEKAEFESMRLNANISRCLHLLKLSLDDFLLKQMPFPLCKVYYPCDGIERVILKYPTLTRTQMKAKDLNEFSNAVDQVFDDYVINLMTFMVRFAMKDDIQEFLDSYR